MEKEHVVFRLNYLLENWKMLVHLFFGTHRFGINNDTWGGHRSLYGTAPFTNLIASYRSMRRRAFLGFIPLNDAIRLFPGYAKKHGYKPIEPPAAS